MAAATVSSLKRHQVGPGLQVLTGTCVLNASYLAATGDSVDLSAYSPLVHQATVISKAGVKWFEVLTTNFSSGQFNVKAMSGAAAVASGDLSSVSADFVVLCAHGNGNVAETLV